MRNILLLCAMAFLAVVPSAFAQTNPERTPPSEPELRYVGRMLLGEALFFDAKTFRRSQGKGYAWLVIIQPDVMEPVWVRQIVDCQARTLTDDYIVWLDRRLKAYSSGERWPNADNAPRSFASLMGTEEKFANAVCTGKPALDTFERAGIGNLRSALMFTRKLPKSK